jgi:putative ABC transport system permease protein
MSVLVGSLIEAWDELRIHKLRVLLSLVGVAVAVAAMTSVLAIGQMLGQANTELTQKWNGRDAMLTVNVNASTERGMKEVPEAMKAFAERFQVAYSSRLSYSWNTFITDSGQLESEIRVVDHAYKDIHNLKVLSGAWFGPGDTQRLAPAIVVNEAYLQQTGTPRDLSVQPKIAISGTDRNHDLVVIGVVPDEWEGEMPRIYILWDSYVHMFAADANAMSSLYPQLEMWLEPTAVEEATNAAKAYFKPYVPDDWGIEAWNNQDMMGEQDNFMDTFQTIVLGIGTLILAIGALSLVNISLVTVQQRIREIGIRRAFGATTGRVFFSIMMESVVATFLAGFIGVLLAVIVVGQFPIVEKLMGMPIENPPPFPTGAAVTGLVVATIIGALAGLIPGLVATRIKPIEAMRAAG